MKLILQVTAIVEGTTGLVLLAHPPTLVRLLFGAGTDGVAMLIARMVGIALVALAIACWPGVPAIAGMLAYNVLATVYFAFIGLGGQWTGILLWPAVAGHGALSLVLGRAWIHSRRPSETKA